MIVMISYDFYSEKNGIDLSTYILPAFICSIIKICVPLKKNPESL